MYVIHGFLTDEERRHILTLAAPEMKRSTVVGAQGQGVVDNIRTSYGMFIRRLADPIIERIERRISLFTQIPISHQVGALTHRHTQTSYALRPAHTNMRTHARTYVSQPNRQGISF